jgi:WD repeat-containing protein 40A
LHGTQLLIQRDLLKERELTLIRKNKIFCSQWLDDRKVIVGTKCNSIEVIDLIQNQSYNIPCLDSSNRTHPSSHACGIHAIEINPSRSLLVTGGSNANDIAVYKLPTMDPLCVGERGHTDYIFDIKWLDDEFLVTGSRDSTIGLWRVDQSMQENCYSSSNSKPLTIKALATKKCRDADKIRALLFNKQTTEIVALSLNAKVHLFSAETLQQKYNRPLPYSQENVCLAQSPDFKQYAVGSKNQIFLLDSNTLETHKKIPTLYPHSGIRSLSFTKDILTIGTGNGHVLFYDLRNGSYLDKFGIEPKSQADLCTSKGYVERDDAYFDTFYNIDYSPAVYTHCYDQSGMKLFTAGGPLPANLRGCYASLWS